MASPKIAIIGGKLALSGNVLSFKTNAIKPALLVSSAPASSNTAVSHAPSSRARKTATLVLKEEPSTCMKTLPNSHYRRLDSTRNS